MSKMKKLLITGISYALVAALAIGGTIAYLQSEDSDVNVMTLGNVQIEQLEYERVVNADGSYEMVTSPKYGEGYKVQPFTQAKPLYPAVGTVTGYGTPVYWDQLGANATGGQQTLAGLKNVQDKFVLVENTGKTDAYVRTIVAVEMGSIPVADLENVVMLSDGANQETNQPWRCVKVGAVEIDGNNYYVYEYIYTGFAGNRHAGGILPAGEISYSNLAQVYMRPEATNEDCEAIDGNGNGTYDILVMSQAVQTAGFENAEIALDTAFGDANAVNVAAWFGGQTIPALREGVLYTVDGDTATVAPASSDVLYRGVASEGAAGAANIVVSEGITRLDNRALCKDTNLKSVTLPDSLTYIDEGVFQQSGFVEIEVPENVTYIGKTAFGACPDLEKIVIKAKNVTFANYVGRDSGKLKEVYIYSDTVTFESGSMYFTNKQTGDASGITFYVSNQAVADALFNASAASRSYGMLIKSIDGATEYYNTLK